MSFTWDRVISLKRACTPKQVQQRNISFEMFPLAELQSHLVKRRRRGENKKKAIFPAGPAFCPAVPWTYYTL